MEVGTSHAFQVLSTKWDMNVYMAAILFGGDVRDVLRNGSSKKLDLNSQHKSQDILYKIIKV